MRKLNVMQMIDVTGRGGAEKALVDIALRLDRVRFNVSVCATRSAGNYQPLLDAARVPTYVMGRSSRWDLRGWLNLVRLLRRERVDVLHAHLFGSNTLGRLLGRLAGVPVVIAHEHWSTKPAREVAVDRLLYRLSDAILVPSRASKETVMALEQIPAGRITVLYNGVDTAQYAPPTLAARLEARRELGIAPDAPVVGVVGRLSPEKGGVDLLIRAAARLRETVPDLRLLVVGDGPLRPALEALAAPFGDTIIFAGTRPDVARMLGAMDIFALPSLHEALPIVVLEAMACGLPVVATRTGGVPEIVEHDSTGLLVPPGDEEALYSALARLLSDAPLRERLSQAGRAQVSEGFTIGAMVEQVEQLYGRLYEEKRPLTARSGR